MNMSQGVAVAVDPRCGAGVPPKQEVTFADGSSLWLHRVDAIGGPDLFERRIEHDGHLGRYVDLRDLAPQLATDLPIAMTRDRPGIVFYTLKHRFKSAVDMLLQAGGATP